MTSQVVYLGSLRTENKHIKSGSSYLTDAPIDNHGKGEAFSPTDTVATGLANCMLTVMGIKANTMEIPLAGSSASVTKTMTDKPRRIAKIKIDLSLPKAVEAKTRLVLEKVGRSCPVFHSLHPDIEKEITFNWNK